MNGQKILISFALLLFAVIGVKSYQKKGSSTSLEQPTEITTVSINLDAEEPAPTMAAEATTPVEIGQEPRSSEGLPSGDLVAQLFNKGEPKLPFVETIRYSSRVDWQPGRSAWVADYARHYETSRHFIARSLNGVPDYLKQNVNNGDHFNVIKKENDVRFHLVVDVTRSKMWFYAHDGKNDERYLLKTYDVGLGRPADSKASGLLTPLGTYSLGDRIATYEPGKMGTFNGERTEMIRVFGTRWIPFQEVVANATEPARGYGIHGAPWDLDEANGMPKERRTCIRQYESDGCVRLKSEDMEELFAIIVTKPTTIELVRDFNEAHLPGREAQF